MGPFIGLVVVGMMAIAGATMVIRELLNYRRGRRWAKAEAIICADERDLRRPSRRQSHYGFTVLFEGPAGPVIARLNYAHGEFPDSFPIGRALTVIYDPNNPSRVEAFVEPEESVGTLLFLGVCFVLLSLGAWQMFSGPD